MSEGQGAGDGGRETPPGEPLTLTLLTTVDLSGRSGQNVATREVVAALARRPGVALRVICPEPAAEFPEGLSREGVDWYWIPRKTASAAWHLRIQPTVARHLARTVVFDRPDALVVRLGPSTVLPAVAAVLARVPFLALVRGTVVRNVTVRVPGPLAPFVRLAAAATLSPADRIYAAYEEVRDELIALPGVSPAAVGVLTNGVDPDAFAPVERARARESLGIDPDAFLVGVVGSFKRRHRVRELLWATRLLREEGLPVRAMLVGDGPRRGELERFVAGLGLESAVSMPGYVAHGELDRYLGACDALYGVVPDARPSNPIKIYEYLASGRPVVTSDREEFAFVAEHATGVLVESVSVAAVADAIRELYEAGASEREEMGRRGREYVLRHATWDDVVDVVLADVSELRQSNRPRTGPIRTLPWRDGGIET